MTGPETTSALPREWSRLHALSPLLHASRAIIALAIVVLPSVTAGGPGNTRVVVDAGLLALAIVAGVVAWLVTRWRISGGELQVETGLIRRQSLRIPLSRLQAVDVIRPLFGRMLGLAEVRIIVAGSGSGKTRLAYLADAQADAVRAQLLALAHGLDSATPEPPEAPLAHVPGTRVLAAQLLSLPALIWVAYLVVSIVLSAVTSTAAVAVTGAIPWLLLGLIGIGRVVGSEWDFTVAAAPDGLRLRAGLLQTRTETVPFTRVQGLRVMQPLWWRPLGWVRVEIDVARRGGSDHGDRESGATRRALLPVGPPALAEWLVAGMFPGVQLHPPKTARAPRRAIVRAPFAWHNLEAAYDKRYAVFSRGRLVRSTTIVPLAKAQSIRWRQGPVLRRLRLANLHIDLAGRRFRPVALCRPADEAAAWLGELPALARAARGVEVSAR